MNKEKVPGQQALETYAGRVQQRLINTHQAILIGGMLILFLTVVNIILLVQLNQKEKVYISIDGIEETRFVSQKTAERFTKSFLKWLHEFNSLSIHARSEQLALFFCPTVSNYDLILLEKEKKRVIKRRVSQFMSLRSLKGRPIEGGFVFEADISRKSSLGGGKQVSYRERFQIVVAQMANHDNTLGLCIERNQLIR